MKKLLFTFLLSLSFVLVLGMGRVEAAECPEGYEKNLLESMEITCGPVTKQLSPSTKTLYTANKYILEGSGTCNWRTPGSTNGYLADVEYWFRNDQYGVGPRKQNPGSVALWNGAAVNIDWGDLDATDHFYSTQFVPSVDGKISLYFHDDVYTDNSGSLDVDIYQCQLIRDAEITSPEEGEIIDHLLSLEAYLIDDDYDTVQWAVRKGTCKANTNTVMGNVDGYTDSFYWSLGVPNTYDFSATADVTTWEEGDYCFIFNPTEDAGEADIRLTRWFIVEYDNDNDGVLDSDDFCDYTDTRYNEYFEMNPYFVEWGQNRWLYTTDGWRQQFTRKGLPSYNEGGDLSETLGCTCSDMLTELNKLGDFVGHWKYGCSSSILEHFVQDAQDGVIDGYNFEHYLERVNVSAKENGDMYHPVYSVNNLLSNKKYTIRASGTANAGDTIEFDAKYSITTRITGDTWTDTVSGYTSYESELLELYVNGFPVDWGTYDSHHVYNYEMTGNDSRLELYINDIYPSNNSGSLQVDIFEYLY